jgi:hypothetical protein
VTWQRGIHEVLDLIRQGKLEAIVGIAADGTPYLATAQRFLNSALREAALNPEAAYVLAYDAARHACTGLLAQQGLRATSRGHHVTVEIAMRSQFGGVFSQLSVLRRRRVEIQYPRVELTEIDRGEADFGVVIARDIAQAAQQLMADLTLFRA